MKAKGMCVGRGVWGVVVHETGGRVIGGVVGVKDNGGRGDRNR